MLPTLMCELDFGLAIIATIVGIKECSKAFWKLSLALPFIEVNENIQENSNNKKQKKKRIPW